MNSQLMRHRVCGWLFGVCAMGLAFSVDAQGQVVHVPPVPVVGSSNPATAEPPVARPSTQPCTVTLFSKEAFNDYSPHAISYEPPPARCRGLWAKVVLTIDFTVTAGVQYDRTASLYLGNANIFYGTTAEPSSHLSPSWHVERDVTDLSAIFTKPQAGQAVINNIVDTTYTGIIYGTAKLLFYPADLSNLPPEVPNTVIPVSGDNGPYALNTGDSQLTTTFTAPQNVKKAYLDIVAQSQYKDEFWYQCVPNDVSVELESCGNTPFRETEITIDGTPAGVAPVYPWIYTGGIDPYLWQPITGVQTLDFKPYRVDLSPFAGVLSDGKQHTIGVSVYNANNYFDVTGNLLLYSDPMVHETSGGILENTLSASPTPSAIDNLSTDGSGNTVGTVTVGSTRDFHIKGYVNTSRGREEITVEQKVDFNSTQTFKVGSSDLQNTVQTSTVHSETTRQIGTVRQVEVHDLSFPLTVDYDLILNADGTYNQVVTTQQRYIDKKWNELNGFSFGKTVSKEYVEAHDTLHLSAGYSILGAGPGDSKAKYVTRNPNGDCYSRKIASKNFVLTEVIDGKDCE